MTGDFIKAPFTDEQVDALNRFQRREDVHSFTCPNHSGMAETDRSLCATVKGWICPHCDYTQDWAHAGMLNAPERIVGLPCDVMLPPALLIRKGVDYSVLMTAFLVRGHFAPEHNRFDDPADKRHAFAKLAGDHPVKVTARDYAYEGILAGVAFKKSGAVRYVVEDGNGRLFIHNHIQIDRPEGWLPEHS